MLSPRHSLLRTHLQHKLISLPIIPFLHIPASFPNSPPIMISLLHNNSFTPFPTFPFEPAVLLRSESQVHNFVVTPTYNVRTDGSDTHVQVEMPGVSKDDVSVEVHRRTMTITGTRYEKASVVHQSRQVAEANGKANGTRAEEGGAGVVADAAGDKAETSKTETAGKKAVRTFKLKLKLGASVDEDGVHFESYEDGVLMLRVCEKAEEAPRKIDLSS